MADPVSVRSHAEAVQKIMGGQKHYVLIDASSNYVRLDHLDDEMLILTYKNRIASAYFNPMLAIRLRVIQIKKKSKSNIKVFNSKKEALQRLRNIWQGHLVTKE